MRTSALVALLVGLVASLAAPAAEPSEKVLYTRADVITATTGEVSVRRAYTRQLRLPSDSCEGGPFTCTVDRHYGQVYMLAFFEEAISRGADGRATVERRNRGRLAIAVDFPKEAESRFEDALTAYIGQLGVAEFARPRAGMAYTEEPLSLDTLRRSIAPVWVCTELDGAYGYDLVVPDQERTHSGGGQQARTACRAIEGAVQDAEPAILRTMPDIRAQLRQEVRIASFSSLGGLTWANRLTQLPEGATLKKTALSGDRKTGARQNVRDGAFVFHEGRYGAVEQDARLPQASLDLAEAPMWITRWTFDATRERFGEDPRSEHEPGASILVAVAPVADPLMEDLERSRTELSVPEDSLIAAAIARFVRSATLGPSLVADALDDPTIWPPRGQWIVVTCRDDGSARYGITPFAEAAQVDNPREACAAIRRQIGE